MIVACLVLVVLWLSLPRPPSPQLAIGLYAIPTPVLPFPIPRIIISDSNRNRNFYRMSYMQIASSHTQSRSPPSSGLPLSWSCFASHSSTGQHDDAQLCTRSSRRKFRGRSHEWGLTPVIPRENISTVLEQQLNNVRISSMPAPGAGCQM
jgi:hypothetical protein